MAPRPGMINRYEMTLTIDLDGSVEIDSDDLIENVHEAVYVYDDANRLLNGRRLRRGISALIGSSIGIDKQERIRDPFEDIRRSARDRTDRDPFEGKYEVESDQYYDLLTALDEKIERIREQQAVLGRAYEAVTKAKEKTAFDAALAKLRVALARRLPKSKTAKVETEKTA